MRQADRDRLVTLKKAKKKLITQKEAAAELGISERQVRRLLKALKRHGDKAVIHGLRGEPSNRKVDGEMQQKAVEILSQPVYQGFRPTLAAEHLRAGNRCEPRDGAALDDRRRAVETAPAKRTPENRCPNRTFLLCGE